MAWDQRLFWAYSPLTLRPTNSPAKSSTTKITRKTKNNVFAIAIDVPAMPQIVPVNRPLLAPQPYTE